MAEVLKLLGHWLLGIVGVLLCYSALFLRTDEEGKIESVIDRWWRKVRVYRKRYKIRFEAAFLKGVAEVTANLFTYVFGGLLQSWRAVLISSCFSLGSFNLVMLILAQFTDEYSEYKYYYVLSLTAFVAAIYVRQTLNSKFSQRLWAAFVGFLIILNIIAVCCKAYDEPSFGLMLCLVGGFGFAIASDFMFIVITRRFLMSASRTRSFIKACALLVGILGIGSLLFFVPIVINGLVFYISDNYGFRYTREIIAACSLIAFTNFLDTMISVLFLVIAILMVLHRLIWPFVERPVYALNRFKIFSKQKKLLFFTGFACICFAWPPVGEKLKAFVELVVK